MTVTNKRLQRLLIKEVVYRWKQHKTIKMRGIQKKTTHKATGDTKVNIESKMRQKRLSGILKLVKGTLLTR